MSIFWRRVMCFIKFLKNLWPQTSLVSRSVLEIPLSPEDGNISFDSYILNGNYTCCHSIKSLKFPVNKVSNPTKSYEVLFKAHQQRWLTNIKGAVWNYHSNLKVLAVITNQWYHYTIKTRQMAASICKDVQSALFLNNVDSTNSYSTDQQKVV